MRPLVSILTPSYQQAAFLPDCLTSVRAQTYAPIEHIVVDGASTDGTAEILETVRHKVNVLSEPDDGQADAVNKAFDRSAGAIIGWINSDDGLFAHTTIEQVVKCFDQNPEAGVVFGDAALVDADGRIRRHYRSHPLPIRRLNPVASPIAQPATFMRRSVIEGSPGGVLNPNLHLTLDLELWLRLRRDGVQFCHLPLVLAVDRDHPARKVRNMHGTPAAITEYADLSTSYGVRFQRTREDLLRSWTSRWAGLPSVVTWAYRYTPAFPWYVDGVAARVGRQLLGRSSLRN